MTLAGVSLPDGVPCMGGWGRQGTSGRGASNRFVRRWERRLRGRGGPCTGSWKLGGWRAASWRGQRRCSGQRLPAWICRSPSARSSISGRRRVPDLPAARRRPGSQAARQSPRQVRRQIAREVCRQDPRQVRRQIAREVCRQDPRQVRRQGPRRGVGPGRGPRPVIDGRASHRAVRPTAAAVTRSGGRSSGSSAGPRPGRPACAAPAAAIRGPVDQHPVA
jgi:hypothetical protein